MSKNSFVLYADILEMVEELEDNQIGVLMRAIIRYESGMELPYMDGMTRIAFKAIKKTLDRDRDKYEKTVEKRAEAGRKSGLKRSAKSTNSTNVNFVENESTNSTNVNFVENESTNSTNVNFVENESTNSTDNDNVSDNDNDNNKKESAKADKKKMFIPPTVEEVKLYCHERGNKVNAQSFVDFYASKGWMIGKNRMKDWRAAVRTWERSNRASPSSKVNQFNQFPQRDYNFAELEKELISN